MPVKISRIETIRVAEFPNLLWVQVHTDEGLTGLGETFFGAGAVEAYLHDTAAPKLLGADPLAIDRLARDLGTYLGFRSTGVEMRGNSAVDIALWDLFGKAMGQPVCQLLGGRTRERIRTYNTCAGSHYVRSTREQAVENWGIGQGAGRYDDLDAFLHRADELAQDLLSEGITAMKIWPFDPYAEQSHGLHISAPDLRRGLEPFEKIRRAVGDQMDIMVEFHSLWQLLPAIRIAEALRPYDTFWHEDPIRMDSLGSLRRYAERSPAPICASETLGSRAAFRDLLETGAAGVVMLDLSWCGGLSEARKIAAMTEAWHLPVAPHDCTGPVVLTASTHLALNAPNALVQESVRAFHRTWYRDLVTALPPIEGGFITIPEGPGLGLALMPDLDRRFSVARRLTDAA
jgi:galactonate dehydratase